MVCCTKLDDRKREKGIRVKKKMNETFNTASRNYTLFERWTRINGKCPYCRKEEVYVNNSVVLASNPPQNQYRCNVCGKVWSAFNNKDAVLPIEEEEITPDTPSITTPSLNDFSQGDGLVSVKDEKVSIKKEDTWIDINLGWICPKCGKVYAPSVQECKSCNGENKP